MARKTGRNEPCPCGSGRKYKKCCLEKDLEQERSLRRQAEAAFAETDAAADDRAMAEDEAVVDGAGFLEFDAALGDGPRARQGTGSDGGFPGEEEPAPGPVAGLRPYMLLKTMEPTTPAVRALIRKMPDARGKVARDWSPSRVRRLSTGVVLAELAVRGVCFDREAFIAKSASVPSAWDAAKSLWPEQLESDSCDVAGFCGMAACVLWERLYEEGRLDRVSYELLDDWIEKGYRVLPDEERAVEIWSRAWNALTLLPGLTGRTMAAADDELGGSHFVEDLLYDYTDALFGIAGKDRACARKAIQCIEECWRAFPEEDEITRSGWRLRLGEFYCLAGDQSRGEEIMREEIDRDPDSACGYVCLDTALSLRECNGLPPVLEERLRILEQARDRPVVDGGDYDLDGRIEALRLELLAHGRR